ncbi:MAG TPA: glycoside hydrolase family 2 TIM barrel-domain containing protein [Streptosporangiaceae bacterium]
MANPPHGTAARPSATRQTSKIADVSRRGFLRAAAGAGTGLAAWSLLGSASPALAATFGGRRAAAANGPASLTAALNADWLFGGVATSGSSDPGFNDSGFARVTVPHVVTPLSWRDWNPAAWQQVWIYRRHFDLPPGMAKLRAFATFQGAMTTATPTFNGTQLSQHQGGYLPFGYELTSQLQARGNVLAVALDATWQNVPPDGNPGGATSVDYLEPGGLYREVALQFVPQVFIADVFASPTQVLSSSPGVSVQATVDAAVVPSAPVSAVARLQSGGRTLATVSAPVQISQAGQVTVNLQLTQLGSIELWDNDNPSLYNVVVTLTIGGQPVHDFTRRIGFREAVFQSDGFFLNGNRVKLFGLNRHQIFPYAGMGMPARVQARDAQLLKQLNCNMVRCSHYPQSPDFLDACDELGIMLWEETPGWGYLGNAAWQQIFLANVHDMVVRDRSRPSVIIWGVQPNEAPRNETLYDQSKGIANQLDGTRPTSGTETAYNTTDWDQDVFAYDDYHSSNGNAVLEPPLPGVPAYLVTEAVGALDGAPFYRWIDTQDVQQLQAKMHAQVHDIAASQDAYCGLLGWCGIDYDSLNGNIYTDVKWPGVTDTFRLMKPGAAFYLSQRDPATGPVIEPSFYWDFNPYSPVTVLGGTATIWSNCDTIKVYLNGAPQATLSPDTTGYPNLDYPPFQFDVSQIDGSDLPELRLDGYIGSRLVLSRSFAASTAGDRLELTVDDTHLVADGSDATRVAFRAVDRFGAPRPYVSGDVTVSVQGPAVWLGQVLNLASSADPVQVQPGQQSAVGLTLVNGGFPFAANGGVGGVYLRTLPGQPGEITVTVSHPALGRATARITATAPPPSPPWLDPPGGQQPTPEQAMTFTGISLALDVPSGWSASATSPTSFTSLAPGAKATATWNVTAPSSGTQGGTVTASASFTLDGSQVSQGTDVPISLVTSLADAFSNTGISDDSDVTSANFDGVGNSFSAQALAQAGLTPGGSFSSGGISFTWPNVPSGSPDNVLSEGQTILVSGSGTQLGFVGAGSPSNEGGTGTIYYTDGSTSSYMVTLDNYFTPPADLTNQIVAQMPYCNDSNPATEGHGQPGQRQQTVYIYCATVPIALGKTVRAVTLPAGGSAPGGGRVTGMHVFALGVG